MTELKGKLSHVELFLSSINSDTPDLVKSNASDLDAELANSPVECVPRSVQTCTNFNDKLLYIFTSGTTGLPKAAVIKNSRYTADCIQLSIFHWVLTNFFKHSH